MHYRIFGLAWRLRALELMLELWTGSIRITDVNNLVNSITLRPVTTEDNEFLLEVYKSSRGDDLRGLGWDDERISEFLDLQYDAQQRFYESEYQQADDRIIMLDGSPAVR